MNEIWKSITGYEGHYEVSDLGRVRSVARDRQSSRGNGIQRIRQRILRQAALPAGYRYVMLSMHNKAKHGLVHRLVAQAFVQNPLGLKIVNHFDGDKSNNSANNLCWVTSSQNNIHAYATRLHRSGGRYGIGGAVLSAKDVRAISILSPVVDAPILADAFGVSLSDIANAVSLMRV